MDVEKGLREALSSRVAEIDSWEPSDLHVGRRRKVSARVGVVTAIGAAALASVVIVATRGAGEPVGGVAIRPEKMPPGATYVPRDTTPPLTCFGQSSTGQWRWFTSPDQAVLDAETALPGPVARDSPPNPVQSPPGHPQKVNDETFADGAWTFRLRQDAQRGWAVSEVSYCPPHP